jgi:hypothetical protein
MPGMCGCRNAQRGGNPNHAVVSFLLNGRWRYWSWWCLMYNTALFKRPDDFLQLVEQLNASVWGQY